MKHLTLRPVLVLASLLASATLSAAVPLRWTVETSRATPAQFEAYQGETLALEAALMSYGKPLEAPSNYSLYWQTNGMGNAWWSIPCTVPSRPSATGADEACRGGRDSTVSNVLFATWSPTNDVGARVYNCFIGQPGTIYHASFQLRLRPSPGATPNELPLPQKVIDFAKVTVLNPPWSGGGGGGGVDTNAVIDIVHKTVDGSARTLPPYLHYLEMDDTYPDAAAEWYAQADYSYGSCSSVRDGNTLSRNYDWNFDFMPEFVVRTVAASATGDGTRRYASLAVCNVGTNLTEADVSSGKWSKWYKALPGHAVDGINENGVVAEINVVDGNPQTSGWRNMCDIHPLGAVRWVLDNGKSAEDAAKNLAARITFPSGLTQNFHYMIADEHETWVVENGHAVRCEDVTPYYGFNHVMTNFEVIKSLGIPHNYYYNPIYTGEGNGAERLEIIKVGSITNAWYTNAYRRETNPPWVSDLRDVISYTNEIFDAWATHPKEYFRNSTNGWWQTVHTSVYDISNCVLRVAVQETDDWYVFQVPSSGAKVDAYTKAETDAKLTPIAAQIASLQDEKLDKTGGTIDGELRVESPSGAGVSITHPDGISGQLDIYPEVNSAGGAFLTLTGAEGGAEINVNGSEESPASIKKDGVEVRGGDDNTCHKTEFGKWKFDNGTVADPQPYLYTGEGETYWLWQKPDDDEWAADGDESSTELTFIDDDHTHMTRSAVCTKDKRFVTEDVVDSKVSSVVSTNNPDFVSAVRNTPTSGMPEDMPTDWGTYGTVGAALAALAAFVKWAKAKIVAVIGDDGKPTDTFATDLLGKPVAISAVQDIIADDVTPATDPSLTKTIATIGGKAIKAPEGGGSQGYAFVDLTPTTESGYKVFSAQDHAINRFTLADATPVKVILPDATDANGRDLIIKVNVTSATMPTFEIVKPSDAASVGIEAADDGWADLEAGINYFTITETDRA